MEFMWNQRAKSDWLQHGDQNTKYFHCKSIGQNKWNFVSGLEDEFGEWIEEENQIGDLLVRYYSNLFTSSNPTQLDPVLIGVEPRVLEEMNEQLLRPGVLSHATKNKTCTPKNICSSANKDRFQKEYLA